MLKSKILAYSEFALVSCGQCGQLCVLECSVDDFYVKSIIGSANHIIGNSATINMSL